MTPILTVYMCKVSAIIHMLWIDQWINHHACTSILDGPDLHTPQNGAPDPHGLVPIPYPLHTYARCLTSFICYWLTYWSTILSLPTHLLDQICKLLKSWLLQLELEYAVQMLSWWSDWGSRPTQNCFHTYCKRIQIVWHHLYAIDWLMDQPSCCHHHPFCPVFDVGSQPKLSDAAGVQMITWWCGWGIRPKWNGPHIHCIQIQGVCHHLYAMDWIINPLSCLCRRTILPRFAYSSKIEWRSLGTNVIMVEWLRLQTNMEWSSHPLNAYMQSECHHSNPMDWLMDQP